MRAGTETHSVPARIGTHHEADFSGSRPAGHRLALLPGGKQRILAVSNELAASGMCVLGFAFPPFQKLRVFVAVEMKKLIQNQAAS